MASDNNYNNNSLQPRLPFLCTPEQYNENQLWIQRQAERFSEVNRRGVEAYLRVESELQRRITEGDQARQQMQHLQQLASARAIMGPIVNGGGPSHYPTPGYMVDQQPAVSSANFVNPTDTFRTNTRGTYTANVASSSREQISHSSGNGAQRGPIQSSNTEDSASSTHLQAAQVQRRNVQTLQLPVMSGNVNADTIQQFARHSLALSQSRASNPISHIQRQAGSNTTMEIGTGPSRLRTHGPQSPPSGIEMVSKQSPVTDPSPILGSHLSVGSSNYVPSSSALSGALGENSNSYPPTGNITQPDFWTIVENQGRSNPGPSTQTQTTPVSVPIHENRSLHNTSHVPQRKATTGLVRTPALPPEPNGDLLRAQAQLAARLKAQLPTQAYANQVTFSNVQTPVAFVQRQGATNGAADRNVNTRGPTMQATPQHQPHANMPLPNGLQPAQNDLSNSLRDTSSPTSNPNVSGAAAPLLFAASMNSFRAESSKSAPSTTVQTNAPNVAFTAAGKGLTPAYAQKQAASLEIGVADASQHYASSAPTMYKPYFMAGPFSSTTDNALSPMQNSHGVPISTGPYSSTQFTTPPPDVNRPSAPMTPASANKKTLAKDILRALGDPSKKRKASTPPSTVSDNDMLPAMKKQAVAPLPVMISDLFTMSSTLHATETDGATRIEEVVDETVSENEPAVAASTLEVFDTAAGAHEELPPVSDPVLASDAPSVPDSLPSQSVGESRASSEPVLHVDTALQPLEDSSIPLFLPSPDSPRETPLSSIRREETRKRRMNEIASTSSGLRQSGQGRKRGTQVFVEVPTLSAAQRQRFLKQDTTNKEATEPKDFPSVLSPQDRFKGRASAVENAVDENRLRLAQEADDVAASRLRKRPCLWNDCFHIANNANSLKAHVWDHVDSIPSKEKLFPCWWGECIRRFNKREALAQHLQNHVKKSIFCAYQGCEEQFAHPLELLTHVESKHPSGSKLRPSVTPFVPPRQTPPPPLRTMFAYHDVHLPVQMARMTKERRAKLGPWVAKNCFGAVSLGTPKLIARNQPQRRRAGDGEAKALTTWEDKYDFAEPWNATYPTHCADLESSKATEDIEGGLLLAPDVAGPQGPLEEQLLTSRVERIKLGDMQEYVIDVERNSEEPEPSEIKLEDTYADLSQGPSLSSASQEPGGVGHQDVLGVGELQLVEPGST